VLLHAKRLPATTTDYLLSLLLIAQNFRALATPETDGIGLARADRIGMG
jgi:hypothetical protein